MAGTTLRLAVQYASERSAPGRAQVRRWVGAALAVLVGSPTARPIDSATLTIRFVDEDEGRSLNRDFRGRNYATNVLTFPLDDGPDDRTVQADIVVCLPVVEAEAEAQGKPVFVHCAHLVVHGALHACGFDHETDADAETMEDLERVVLARFGLTDPYRVVDAAHTA